MVRGGMFSVILSVTWGLGPSALAFARHAAFWCSDFPLAQHRSCQRPPITSPSVTRKIMRFHWQLFSRGGMVLAQRARRNAAGGGVTAKRSETNSPGLRGLEFGHFLWPRSGLTE